MAQPVHGRGNCSGRKKAQRLRLRAKIAITGYEIGGRRGRRVGQDYFCNGRLKHCCTLPRKMYLETTQPERRAVARTTLRRGIPSFTVEVRRRPRLATTSNPNAPSSETRPPQAAFDRESSRAAAAAFGAKMDSSPVDVAPSHPRGRILPSLVPDEPRHRLLEDAPVSAADSEPPSRAPKRPLGRALKRGDQASKSRRNSSFSSGENAPLAERSSTNSQRTSSVQSDVEAGATTRAPS